MKGKGMEVRFGDRRCRGASWNQDFHWQQGDAKQLGDLLGSMAAIEEISVDELISAMPAKLFEHVRRRCETSAFLVENEEHIE